MVIRELPWLCEVEGPEIRVGDLEVAVQRFERHLSQGSGTTGSKQSCVGSR